MENVIKPEDIWTKISTNLPVIEIWAFSFVLFILSIYVCIYQENVVWRWKTLCVCIVGDVFVDIDRRSIYVQLIFLL